MSAQPVHQDPDPRDPQVILDALPAAARAEFLAEYEAAVETARRPAGYRALQELLQTWHARAVAYSQPDFFERAADARAGRGDYVPMDEVIAQRHTG